MEIAARPWIRNRWSETGGGLQSSLDEEALRERRQTSDGQVEFDAFNAVHGKENHRGSERLAVSHHHGQVLEGGEFRPAQAKALGRKGKDHSPELFPRIAQGDNHERAGQKWLAHFRGWSAAGGMLFHAKDCRREKRALQMCLGNRFVIHFLSQTPVCWADMPTTAAAPVIEFRDVSYRVAETQVLSGFDLEVQSGETLVLLGRSGSGKTTSLKLVNRLLSPTSGEIRVNGVPNTDADLIRLRRSIGYVIQDVGLFPHFDIERNIGLVPKIEGWPQERIRARVKELLQMVGLPPETAARYPHQLSGGQRQRVGVARALAADPEILLMDEPFGALDPLTRDELQREFLLLQRRLHKTVVFVTHDLREALRLGSRIALMEAGRLFTVLAPAEFLRSTEPLASAYVRAFGDGLESAANRGTS